MTPLKLAEIEAEKRYPHPIEIHERAAFIAGAEMVEKDAGHEVYMTKQRAVKTLYSIWDKFGEADPGDAINKIAKAIMNLENKFSPPSNP